MALDKKTFRIRTLTAIVFAAVMLIGLFTNFWIFFILFSIIHIGCWWEYISLVEKIHSSYVHPLIKYYLVVCGFTIIWVLGFTHHSSDFYLNLFSVKISFKLLGWILQALALYVFVGINNDISVKGKWVLIAGLIYLSLPITMIIYLRNLFDTSVNGNIVKVGLILPCAIVFSIWINDTMAYIVGSLIGKTPFSKISPKKTWEGTIGGAILCVIVIGLLGTLVPVASHIPVQHWVAIAAICAVFGTLGDLLQSKIKRLANVKDSGSFMPGHGGFLDRFDSLLIATPAVWLYIKFFM
ncbi:MAG: phosphatidate cytidylyltransferase [Gloeobacteraceae cyanobacterium ES-bin-316]|nr:phosphatidate cytidylyltransferase [Ferruginibacter sp.]